MGVWAGLLITICDVVAAETLLFAAVFFLLLGIDDLLVDTLWSWRAIRRRLTVYRWHRRQSLLDFPEPRRRFAIFVPAWDESAVIGDMLRSTRERLRGDFTIFVGCYPNDRPTIAAVAAVARDEPRIQIVLNRRCGPTTKADNLNALWRAMRRFEDDTSPFDAVVFHDAEDLVHSGELAVFDRLLDRAAVVQLPVLPLIDSGSRWIAGHYADEFADGHGRQLVLREALGAALPLAGTGFALHRNALAFLADRHDDAPFDAASLTEDYELGIAMSGIGAQAIFARVPAAPGLGPVAVRAYFPATLRTAVAQKSRWLAGIAFAGWDRTGWGGRGWREVWMRMRDRRAPVAMLVILCGYIAAGAWLVGGALRFAAGVEQATPDIPDMLIAATGILALWRLTVRGLIVGSVYGPAEGLRSVPRTLVANLVLLLSGWRALRRYLMLLRGERPDWGKTAHIFPAIVPAE